MQKLKEEYTKIMVNNVEVNINATLEEDDGDFFINFDNKASYRINDRDVSNTKRLISFDPTGYACIDSIHHMYISYSEAYRLHDLFQAEIVKFHESTPVWQVPVLWEMKGYAYVSARTRAEAEIIVKDKIIIPKDGEYVDMSYKIAN